MRYFFTGILGMLLAAALFAEEPKGEESELASAQRKIAENFSVLEKTLLRMSEILSVTDPGRSETLTRAILQSREKKIRGLIDEAAALLREESYAQTLDVQERAIAGLKEMLTLLESENRNAKVRDRRERIKAALREIGQRIREQQGLESRTEQGMGEPKELSQKQAELARKTGELARKIAEEKNDENTPSEGESGEASSGEASEETRAQENLRAAQKRMEQAQKKLDEANRRTAADEQRQALKELEAAKAQLEETLRQLREEEAKRYLAMLETRLKKIQQMQKTVYEETLKRDKVPEKDRGYEHTVETTRMSRREGDIVLETEKALLLLREEGSSRMFPEVMEQMVEDMRRVADMLAHAKVDTTVQVIEEDILASLEEMLAAVRKSQQDLQDEESMPPGSAGESDADPGLVDRLAEVRMIRSSQLRVNRRTKVLEAWAREKGAGDSDVQSALDDLSRQQERIRKITREIGARERAVRE
ncbi:MAG: hypothetical protein Q4D98_13090 [Planctomycetia bacterium]|nr:hypothetical protein [Planctomycetia bacterium]